MARLRHIVTIGALALFVGIAQMGDSALAASPASPMARSLPMASERMAQLRQSADTPSSTETPPSTDAEPDAEWTASAVEVLRRQGAQEMEALRRLDAIPVLNPLPAHERATDGGPALTAAIANFRIAATAGEDAAIAPTVEAHLSDAISAQATRVLQTTMDAREAAAASTAAIAEARATADARATRFAKVTATIARFVTIRVSRHFASHALGASVTTSDAAAATGRIYLFQSRGSMLPLGLIALLATLCLYVRWRGHGEPFVIKAKPARV